MKIKQLREKSTEELKKLYIELCQKRQALKFKAASKQLKHVRELRDVIKTAARILTLQKERKDKEGEANS